MDAVQANLGAVTPTLHIERGLCQVLFAYDVGFAINLDECDGLIKKDTQRKTIKRKRRAPRYFEYQPLPLQLTLHSPPISLLHFQTRPAVDVVLYDFGALTISYEIGIEGPFEDLLRLSDRLYDHEGLLVDSGRCVEEILEIIRPAVTRPHSARAAEDYCIFSINALRPAVPNEQIRERFKHQIAQILRANAGPLSEQEIADAHQCRISFGPNDLAIIDWNAAMIFDDDPEDLPSLLEYANVELLEMRVLDEQLDRYLQESYEALVQRERRRFPAPRLHDARLKRVAMLQMDSALLFEGVNNALKLVGDQYLARVYRLASDRFHLKEWDESILRKLSTLESIYQKMSHQASNQRMEVLEWIIILLIAISIIIPFIPGLSH